MTKFKAGLTAVIATAAFSFTTLVESNAAPIYVPKMATAQSDAIQVGGRHWRRGYRNGWYGGGALIAGALIGGAIANSRYYGNGYYGNGYYGNNYGDPYYGNGYYRPRYQQRAYYPRADAYRRGFEDGYRAGVNDAVGGVCSPRLADAGRC